MVGLVHTGPLGVIQARTMAYAIEGGPSDEQVKMCQDAWQKVVAVDPTYKTQTQLLYSNLFTIAPEAL